MTFAVNPEKVLRLFAPLWALLALSLWLHWQSWQSKPAMLALIASLPILAALASGFMRERWRIELTPDAFIHHTLGGSARFEWSRMGPLTMKPAPVSALLFVRTFWFAYPIDAPRNLAERGVKLTGERILCVFGDLPAHETIAQIEQWRALHVTARL